MEFDTLVLQGSSTRGFIFLGALDYAYNNNMLEQITTYVGTSSGSMISYLLAIGYTPIEIMVFLSTNNIMEKMQNYNIVGVIQGNGAISYTYIQEQLEKLTINKIGYLPTLNDLYEKYNKTLVCVTYNLTEERTEYISWNTNPELPCLIALRMSSNLPLIFENFYYGNCLYVDGGISDNFPIEESKKYGKKILGITELNISNKTDSKNMDMLEFIYNLMFVPIKQNMQNQIEKLKDEITIATIKHDIDLKVCNFTIDRSSRFNMFTIGYQKMKEIFLL